MGLADRLANTAGCEITAGIEGMDPAAIEALSSNARLRFVAASDEAARAASFADESLASSVSPQAWIDGKILRIGAYALVNIANIAIGSVLLLLVANVGWGPDLPGVVAASGIPLLLLVFCVLAHRGTGLRDRPPHVRQGTELCRDRPLAGRA